MPGDNTQGVSTSAPARQSANSRSRKVAPKAAKRGKAASRRAAPAAKRNAGTNRKPAPKKKVKKTAKGGRR